MEFVDFALQHGLIIKRLLPGGPHRCGTVRHPKSRNGAYKYDGDSGWVQNWEVHAEVVFFRSGPRRRLSRSEKRALKRSREAHQRDLEKRQKAAAARAAEMLEGATPRRHDYLFRKGFPEAVGLTLSTGELIVPMRDWRTNNLVGLQVVRWDESNREWEKRFLPGTRLKGALMALGRRRAREFILCEGYATGLSIEHAVRKLALDICVIVCFSAGNMVHVARMLRSGRGYCFADNDASGTGERAAQTTGLPYCMSPRVGEDANDLHVRAGVLEVCRLIAELRATSGPPGR